MEGTWTGIDSGTTNSGMEVWEPDSSGMEAWDSDNSGMEVWDSDSSGMEVWDSESSGMEVWDSDSSGMEIWESDTSGLIVLISEICLPSKPSQCFLAVSPGVMLTGWDRSSPIICPRDRFWVNVCCIPTHSFLEVCLEPGVCHIAVEASEVIDTSG